MSGSHDSDIMIGGLVGWGDLGTISNVESLLDSGRVGLYIHEQLLNPAYNDGNGYNFSNPTINGEVTTVFGQTIGATGNVEYEGRFPDTAGYWGTSAPTLGLDYPFATLPTINLPEPNSTDSNLNSGSTFATVDDFYNFWNSSTIQQEWTSYVNAAMADGISSVAPIFSPNSFDTPNTFEWDTLFFDPIYAGLREMASSGHALALDAPPGFIEQLNSGGAGAEYLSFTEQEIEWANSQNLRSDLILCPYGDDSTFAADVQNFVGSLAAAGAVPAQFIIENYNVGGSSLAIGSDTDPNSLAGVALWLTDRVPTYVSGKGPEINTATSSTTGQTITPIPIDMTINSNGLDVINLGSALTASDAVYAYGGSDTVYAGGGNDTIYAGTGQQTIYGSGTWTSSLTVIGNSGSMEFIGGSGSETLWLGGGNSTIYGGSHQDTFVTGSGNSVIVSGSAPTSIWLQTGNANVYEGTGAVHYEFFSNTGYNFGVDYISSFKVGTDTLQVSAWGSNEAASLIANQQHYNGSTILRLPDNTQIVLVNVGSVDGRFFS